MRDTKLIVIEGLPGSGKSTLAHVLSRHLRAHGISARWWYEEETAHPLYVFHDDTSLQSVVEAIFSGRHAGVVAATLARWRAFAEQLLSSDTLAVLDSCLFGYLTWTLFPGDVPVEAISAYVAQVEQIIAPLNPSLIYLRQSDVGTALQRICDRRGGETEQRFIERATLCPYGRRKRLQGFEGAVAFWTAYQDYTDDLFGRSLLVKHAIQAGEGEWSASERQALDFLDLATSGEARPAGASLAQFAGAYTSVDWERPRSCAICLTAEGLRIDGLAQFWPMNRLTAKADRVFEVEAFPFDVTFEVDASGTIRGMRLDGPQLFGGGGSGRFLKDPEAEVLNPIPSG